MTLVSVQNPLRIDAFIEPEPDLLLLRPRADDYRASRPSAADTLLLIEVADAYVSRERRTGGSLAPDLVPGVAIDVAALLA